MALSTYVALLRGINVGGNNVIPMKALKVTFEELKLTNVKTYIASGNVLFQCAPVDCRKLEKKIEGALRNAHAYDARVVLKTKDELLSIAHAMPRAWKKQDPAVRYNVCFLRHEIDDPKILEELSPKKGIEQLSYTPGALFWSAHRDDLTRTAMVKLSSHRLYKDMTVRNANTARKLAELLQQLS
ncbi:MAG: DUF1697 domain-containing protein [Deltaproteobacteria bacterium]|nr:DUF1697 domain-containing protein [Deltaproteobacteria bacterium]